MDFDELIEKYREQFNTAFNEVMEHIGNDFTYTKYILESAFDLSINDQMNKYCK